MQGELVETADRLAVQGDGVLRGRLGGPEDAPGVPDRNATSRVVRGQPDIVRHPCLRQDVETRCVEKIHVGENAGEPLGVSSTPAV